LCKRLLTSAIPECCKKPAYCNHLTDLTSREMNIKSIKWRLVISCGWFVILVAAAIILPPLDSRRLSGSAVPMLTLVLVWLLLTAVALGVYFYRGVEEASLSVEHSAVRSMVELPDRLRTRIGGRAVLAVRTRQRDQPPAIAGARSPARPAYDACHPQSIHSGYAKSASFTRRPRRRRISQEGANGPGDRTKRHMGCAVL
jgi:hypothetical protein